MDRTDKALWIALLVGSAAMLLGGCAPRTVRPDEMSAEGHRQEAAKERAIADSHGRQYDPKANASQRVPAHADIASDPSISYNPTDWHLREAVKHSEHARQHEAAATQLERFESAECQAFAPHARAACPMMGPVAAIVAIENGVRFELADPGQLDAVVGHMRCHLAYARARGWQPAADCPLYIKGIDVRRSADGRAVEIISGERRVAAEVQRRTDGMTPKQAASQITDVH